MIVMTITIIIAVNSSGEIVYHRKYRKDHNNHNSREQQKNSSGEIVYHRKYRKSGYYTNTDFQKVRIHPRAFVGYL